MTANLFGDDDRETCLAGDVMQAWNECTSSPLPKVRELTPARRRHLSVRLSERPLSAWREIFTRIQASSFCTGVNQQGWIANFDWVIRSPEVAVRVIEGVYDDRRPAVRARDLTCPHTPPCPAPGRWACQQKTTIEAYKRAQPAGRAWRKFS